MPCESNCLATNGTAAGFRGSLHGRLNRSLLGLLAFASAAATAGLVALAGACASGSSDTSSYDGGDDSSTDGAPGEGGGSSGGEGGHPEGGGTSLMQACIDNDQEYCNKLFTCSSFLLQEQYGDMPTCVMRLQPYCNAIVAAKGNGWTGDGLEACVAARDKLSCTDFFYGKPQPAACRPTGTITSGACLFDSQCGTGYCRIAAGSQCGNCVQLGNTGAACATTNDCDGNLVCANSACAAPVPIGGACSASSPCQSGAVCLPVQAADGGAAGKCIQPGGVGASCDADGGGTDCDQAVLGAYCSGGMCGAITVAMSASLCGGSPPSVCYASGACQGGFCVPPIADGQPCDGGQGCTIPSTCNAGTCGTPNASLCH